MDSHLQQLQDTIRDAIQNMTAKELSRSRGTKWSPAQVLEHLQLSYSGTVKGCQRSLSAGQPLATPRTLKHRASVLLVVGLGYLPEGRSAPESTLPRGESPETVVASVFREIELMDEAIRQCESRYGPKTCILDHPVLGALTAAQWRKFHLVHGRHHAKQIHKMRSDQS